MSGTDGYAAFDEATQKRLAELRQRPVDCFGERIELKGQRPRLADTLARGPQRAALLAVRQNCGRHAIAGALDAMVRAGQASRDEEGFYSLEEAAFGP